MSLPSRRRGVFRIDPRIKVDADDIELLRSVVGPRSIYVNAADGYAYFSSEATGPVGIHTVIVGRFKAGFDGFKVDHINGDPLDNRRENLRVVPDQVNQLNRHVLNKNNRSGYRGVSRSPRGCAKPWRATLTVNRRQIHLGLFETEEEAFAARRIAEAAHLPEMCRLLESGGHAVHDAPSSAAG